MELSRNLLWSQGVFLTPQHFQQRDFSHQADLAALWRTAMPFGWGIAGLGIRESGVEREEIDIVDLRAVLPDGVFLRAGTSGPVGANARIRVASFRHVPKTAPVAVYVALARHLPDENVIAEKRELDEGGLLNRRYVVEDGPVHDAFDREQPEPAFVSWLSYLLQLVFVPLDSDHDRRIAALVPRFELLQVARLKVEGNRLVLDPVYVPPALELEAVPHVLREVASLCDNFVVVMRQFADLRRDRGVGVEVGATRDVALYFVLRSLNQHASVLKQIVERRRVHPADLYHALRQAVAELAALSRSTDYLGEAPAEDNRAARDLLPAYDHNDIGPRVTRATTRVRDLLNELEVGPAMSVELVFDNDTATWMATIKPEFFDGRLPKFFLLVESALGAEQVQSRLNDRKIGSHMNMRDLIDRRLLGLSIEYQRYVPDHLPQRSNRYTYFEIDQRDVYWEPIKRDGSIHLYCPEISAADATIRLVKTISDR